MSGLSRRRFLQIGAVAGAAVLLPVRFARRAAAALPGGTLDPTTIRKHLTPLVIPPAMPLTSTVSSGTIDRYVVGVRQFRQQILPPGLPATTVWGYGSQSAKRTFNTRRSPSRPAPIGRCG